MTSRSRSCPTSPRPATSRAVEKLSEGVLRGDRFQTLLGITGSGKSATIAWTIERVQRPTLILAPNKSLAAQLAQEMREFFPNNRVEYFVSYYDYYQPEAYIPSTDTYIEKDSSINDEIDRLRHSATAALLTRRDTIVVASVSCIYGMGSPDEYRGQLIDLSVGVDYDMRSILRRLVDMQFDRNDAALGRGKFRVRGDTIEVHPSYEESVLRIEMFGDTVDRLTVIDPLTGETLRELNRTQIFPATHYVAGAERLATAMVKIEAELQERLAYFEREGKLLEAQRLRMRTQYDLEMMAEVGYCNGIENYSMHIDGRDFGQPPFTLLDYFPDDFLLVIDESHVAVPQLHGQFEGDRSRKDILVEHGFRLPSARDNRPLTFDEVLARINQCVFMSATPAATSCGCRRRSSSRSSARPASSTRRSSSSRPRARSTTSSRASTTASNAATASSSRRSPRRWPRTSPSTCSSRACACATCTPTSTRCSASRSCARCASASSTCSSASTCCARASTCPRCRSSPSSTPTRRASCARETSLIQTIGRAARNVDGQVVMYADRITDSMRRAIDITQQRRARQIAYNAEHGINPQTIRKAVGDILSLLRPDDLSPVPDEGPPPPARARQGAARAARRCRSRRCSG